MDEEFHDEVVVKAVFGNAYFEEHEEEMLEYLNKVREECKVLLLGQPTYAN